MVDFVESAHQVEVKIETAFDRLRNKFHAKDWESQIASHLLALESRIASLESQIANKV